MSHPSSMIFWGATGQALVLREALRPSGAKLLALFDNNPAVESPFPDVPVHHGVAGFRTWRETHAGEIGFLVAIGGHAGKARLELHDLLVGAGLTPMVVTHAAAWLADGVTPGPGSVVLARAAVAVDARIGRQCIINTSASVDHECVIGDGAHIGPGAVLAGCVEVGRLGTVYSGATVGPRVKIGEGAVVGAGSVVLNDVPPWTLVAGAPAHVIRKIES
jgi:sugar O-acyltransferase (sialic acid O-acetyltransferase NeuD family)